MRNAKQNIAMQIIKISIACASVKVLIVMPPELPLMSPLNRTSERIPRSLLRGSSIDFWVVVLL